MATESFEAPLDLDNLPDPVDKADYSAPDDSVEVEVVDDTPPEDRGRAPLPEKIVEQLEKDDEEVEEYSTKVKQRIDQMKKAWHDERRAKETAMREREEAVRVAQQAYQERQSYLERLRQGEVWAIEQAKQRSALQFEQAKRAYREAYEAGDSEKVIDAHQALNSAMMEYERLSQYQPQYAAPENFAPSPALQPQQDVVYNAPAVQPVQEESVPQPDSRTMEWGQKNTWFGQDDEMTSFALGVHQKLVKEGVSPQTDEYYERIDSRMREVFPDKFGGKKRQSSTVVAPVGRSPKGKKVVLTQTQIALAKRLGITPEAYARELVKQMEN